MREKRRYFRINDTVQLKYQVAHEDSVDIEIQQNIYQQNRLVELRKSYSVIDTHLLNLIEVLGKESPLISEALSLVDKKISLLAQIVSIHGEYDENIYPVQEVNISASGIAFGAHEPLTQNTQLKIELVLYPECHYILLYARTVHCKEEEKGAPHRFIIAAEFIRIGEESQDKIIQHILKKQAEELAKASDAAPEDIFTSETTSAI